MALCYRYRCFNENLQPKQQIDLLLPFCTHAAQIITSQSHTIPLIRQCGFSEAYFGILSINSEKSNKFLPNSLSLRVWKGIFPLQIRSDSEFGITSFENAPNYREDTYFYMYRRVASAKYAHLHYNGWDKDMMPKSAQTSKVSALFNAIAAFLNKTYEVLAICTLDTKFVSKYTSSLV